MSQTISKSAKRPARREQQRWIDRYKGHFGSPIGLDEFRAGTITFRELYDRSLRMADNMLAEVQSINSIAFYGEEQP